MVAVFVYPVTPHSGVPTRFLQEESAPAASAGSREGRGSRWQRCPSVSPRPEVTSAPPRRSRALLGAHRGCDTPGQPQGSPVNLRQTQEPVQNRLQQHLTTTAPCT